MRVLPGVGLALLLVGTVGLSAAEVGTSADWPEFHGPRRDNLSADRGLLKTWPPGGPRLVWEFSDCGKGVSGVAIANGRIFTAGDFEDEEYLIALSMDGRRLWRSPNGRSWRGPIPGSRSTPTYADGVLYHLNPTGRLTAFQADSGAPIWSVDLETEFDAQYGIYALAENLAVDGDRLLCLPGGTQGRVVALDKRTGRTLWNNTTVNEPAAYCSPLVVTWQGVRQMLTLTQKSAISVNVETGELLWSYPYGRKHVKATMPIFHQGYVFITCGYGDGGTLLKINPDSRGVTPLWHKDELDNCHGGVLLIDGRLYGSGCRNGGEGFFCADFFTGRVVQTDRTLGKLSLTWADGMIYGLSDKCRVSLLAITPGGFQLVSQFDLPRQRAPVPACHPVVCGGRLYAATIGGSGCTTCWCLNRVLNDAPKSPAR